MLKVIHNLFEMKPFFLMVPHQFFVSAKYQQISFSEMWLQYGLSGFILLLFMMDPHKATLRPYQTFILKIAACKNPQKPHIIHILYFDNVASMWIIWIESTAATFKATFLYQGSNRHPPCLLLFHISKNVPARTSVNLDIKKKPFQYFS